MTKHSIVIDNISKSFGGIKALQDVSMNVKIGEVHGLIGENGAGKSTLIKILAGAYRKDDGEIKIFDQVVPKSPSPKDMIGLGISVIYQEFMLAPDLTVAENICIDELTKGGVLVNWKEIRQKAQEQLERLDFTQIKPDDIVGDLSVASQQIVEVAKCLVRDSRILIFDEPTAVLTFSETRKLLSLIKKLKEDGVTVIYISHRLEELFEICDQITVLKDGALVDTVVASEITKESLVNMMVGRQLDSLFPARNAKIGKEVLRVENLEIENKINNVSFVIKEGEVVGFSGLVGSGRTETMRAIFGIDKKTSGNIHFIGKEVNFKHPKEAIQAGMGLLPEDRKTQGLLLEQSIRLNTTLSALQKVKNMDIISKNKESQYTRELLAKLNTKYNSINDNANSLSGGNQQKIVIAKWLATDSKCIIFDEPTRGVDVGAKTEIYKIINELAENGVAVIVIASEMPEIIGLCDRSYVMNNGEIVGELQKEQLSEQNLIQLSMGV